MPAGSGDSGELGTGGTSQSNIPVAVSGGLTFSHIAAGTSYSCGVLVNGSAFCWGTGGGGQLGNGLFGSSLTPTPVLGDYTFTRVTASSQSGASCGILTNTSALCWGDGNIGQMGSGVNQIVATPTAVAGGFSFQTVATGSQHSCAIVAS
ncbi:hypothetical protein D9Q98_003848 [Chlorella vulgaris]|uniref:Uncharacterized protein n=1 Tax=Chlorella vulgaris TaxID=3077 RepID=A0A9D4TR00_CHLVU|nr:hypothetical protein D9Q98_003848 [Chlorella vulgaris]